MKIDVPSLSPTSMIHVGMGIATVVTHLGGGEEKRRRKERP